MAFGQTLLARRKAHGLTLAAIAVELGVSVQAVRGWEIGRCHPSAKHWRKLRELLRLDERELMAALEE